MTVGELKAALSDLNNDSEVFIRIITKYWTTVSLVEGFTYEDLDLYLETVELGSGED